MTAEQTADKQDGSKQMFILHFFEFMCSSAVPAPSSWLSVLINRSRRATKSTQAIHKWSIHRNASIQSWRTQTLAGTHASSQSVQSSSALDLRKNSSNAKVPPSPSEGLPALDLGEPMSGTASYITNHVMGLSAPAHTTTFSQPRHLVDAPSRGRDHQSKTTAFVAGNIATTSRPILPVRPLPVMHDFTTLLAPRHK